VNFKSPAFQLFGDYPTGPDFFEAKFGVAVKCNDLFGAKRSTNNDLARSPQTATVPERQHQPKEGIMAKRTKPSIVFVHGIWADGSCFSKLIPTLQAEGHEVIAAQYGLDTVASDVAAGPCIPNRTVLSRSAWGRPLSRRTAAASPCFPSPISCLM
jgi:hypothetical protein